MSGLKWIWQVVIKPILFSIPEIFPVAMVDYLVHRKLAKDEYNAEQIMERLSEVESLVDALLDHLNEELGDE